MRTNELRHTNELKFPSLTLSAGMCTYEQPDHTQYQVRVVTGYHGVPGKRGDWLLGVGYLVREVTRYEMYPNKSSVFRLIDELNFFFILIAPRRSHTALNNYFNVVRDRRRAIEIK